MRCSPSPVRHKRLKALLLAGALSVCLMPRLKAQQESIPAQENSPATQAQDAAAKAAERKKRFEEQRRRLDEDSTSNSEGHSATASQTLFISPAVANMVLGDTQPFCAFDIDGKTMTHSVQWSISNSSVAELSTSGDPTIISKSRGTATLRAQIGATYAEAKVTVIPGSALPIGSVRWSSGDIPGFKTTKILPAVPSASGVDVFEVAQNAQGEQLVRALLSDGRQLWMRYFSKGTHPSSIPGMPSSTIAH
jgi:hypothetical protein